MNNGLQNSWNFGGSPLLLQETTPPEIIGDVDNYLPRGLRIARRIYLRLSSDAVRTVSGLKLRKLLPRQEVIVMNVGTNVIVLAHEGGGSDPENRFLSPITVLGLGANFNLDPRTAVLLLYDVVVSRWRVISYALDLL